MVASARASRSIQPRHRGAFLARRRTPRSLRQRHRAPGQRARIPAASERPAAPGLQAAALAAVTGARCRRVPHRSWRAGECGPIRRPRHGRRPAPCRPPPRRRPRRCRRSRRTPRPRPAAGAIAGFRQRKTVGVIGQPHLAPQRRLPGRPQGPAVQPGGVGVLDRCRCGVSRAGDRQADTPRARPVSSSASRTRSAMRLRRCRHSRAASATRLRHSSAPPGAVSASGSVLVPPRSMPSLTCRRPGCRPGHGARDCSLRGSSSACLAEAQQNGPRPPAGNPGSPRSCRDCRRHRRRSRRIHARQVKESFACPPAARPARPGPPKPGFPRVPGSFSVPSSRER